MKTGQEAHAGGKFQLVALYLRDSMRSGWTAKQSNKILGAYFALTTKPAELQFVSPRSERANIRPRRRLSPATNRTRGR